MNKTVYRPGTWQVIVEESGVIAVPADTAPDRVHRLSEMLRDGAPALTEVIDALADGSITSLGSFAVALDSPDGVRFAVRGPVHVHITGAAPADGRVSGADVTTWSERFVTESRNFELVLDESATSTEYPIRSGIVLAGVVRAGEVADVVEDAAPAGVESDAAVERDAVAESDAGVEPDAGSGPVPSVLPLAVVPAEAEPSTDDEPQPLVTEPASADVEPAVTEPIEQVESQPTEQEPVASEVAPGHQTLLPSELTYAPLPSDEEQGDQADDDSGAAPSLEDLFPDATVQVAPSPTVVAPPAPVSSDFGDHDGATISVAEARRLRAESAAPDAPTAVLPVVDQPTGATGRVRVSSGQVIELDRTVIIGRRPRATRASGSTLPHLVAVESPQQDISRSHLEVRPEGDSVVIIDLHTTNGSTLLRPGADPMRLHPGEHTLVLDGDVVDLGDGITVSFEGLA